MSRCDPFPTRQDWRIKRAIPPTSIENSTGDLLRNPSPPTGISRILRYLSRTAPVVLLKTILNHNFLHSIAGISEKYTWFGVITSGTARVVPFSVSIRERHAYSPT
jgi:hypothetical protein